MKRNINYYKELKDKIFILENNTISKQLQTDEIKVH